MGLQVEWFNHGGNFVVKSEFNHASHPSQYYSISGTLNYEVSSMVKPTSFVTPFSKPSPFFLYPF